MLFTSPTLTEVFFLRPGLDLTFKNGQIEEQVLLRGLMLCARAAQYGLQAQGQGGMGQELETALNLYKSW